MRTQLYTIGHIKWMKYLYDFAHGIQVHTTRNLKPGDKVKQKMYGYIFTVEETKEVRPTLSKDYIEVVCKADTGEIMKHSHKELLLCD